VAEAFGDPGSKRDNTLFFELEDRPQVHLGGIDEIAHLTIVRLRSAPAHLRRESGVSESPSMPA
jgi:hypothetical protein